MNGEFIVFLSAKNPIFYDTNNGDKIKKIIEDLQNKIYIIGFKKIEPIFVISSIYTELSARLMQEWLSEKRNHDLIHTPKNEEESSIIFSSTILSKVRAHPLVVCIYHNNLSEIFQQFFPHATMEPKNDSVLLTNLSAITEEEQILYCSS